jgi:hypothetical protein
VTSGYRRMLIEMSVLDRDLIIGVTSTQRGHDA